MRGSYAEVLRKIIAEVVKKMFFPRSRKLCGSVFAEVIFSSFESFFFLDNLIPMKNIDFSFFGISKSKQPSTKTSLALCFSIVLNPNV